jgi:hypothetical protein
MAASSSPSNERRLKDANDCCFFAVATVLPALFLDDAFGSGLIRLLKSNLVLPISSSSP